MGRFFKELKYSLGMKKHLFFIIMVAFAACGAAWLFQESLKKELKKAFPSTYDVEHIPNADEQYQLSAVLAKNPQVTDADLKAEILFNQLVREADWVGGYEEIATEYVRISTYRGPDSAVKGYGTNEFYDNKDIDSSGAKYTTVKAVWMDEELARKFKLGSEAATIYGMPNNYLEKVYVMLGADYNIENGYRVGNILKAKNSEGDLQLQVVGFLPKNAKAEIGNEVIDLNSCILCPFISLKDVYIAKDEIPAAYTDGVYVPMKILNDDFLSGAYRNNPPGIKQESKTGIKYAEVRSLWIERSAIPEDAPDWLKTLAASATGTTTPVMVGHNYHEAGTVLKDATFDSLSGKDITKLQAIDFLPQGTTWNVYGLNIVLDDYLVFIHEAEKKEDENAQNGNTTPDGTNPEGGEGDPIFIDEPEVKEREFKADERSKLFHYQLMMNRGYITTKLTRNEAQIALAQVIEESWMAFRRDNPKKDPLSSYRISGSSKDNSILYRKNSMKLADKIMDFTKKGFPICMLLFAAYLAFKLYRGKEYYTSLYLTGTNRLEIMALYLIEGILLTALAAALAFGFSFVICKLLNLAPTAPKPVIKRICKLVAYPTVITMIWILIRDFGRMFRRTQEV